MAQIQINKLSFISASMPHRWVVSGVDTGQEISKSVDKAGLERLLGKKLEFDKGLYRVK